MQRALSPDYMGALPDSWRVRSFFRFFGGWCSLVSQQHAVEVAVHYDWLAAPTGRLRGDARRDLLAHHRKVELELHSISRLETKVLRELASAEWSAAEPCSKRIGELRQRVRALCDEIRAHLDEQETTLPPLLRGHWGVVSPPQAVRRSLLAAGRAQAAGSKGRERPVLLLWVLHYLRRRNPQRARYFAAALPVGTRVRAVLCGAKHSRLLSYLRAIVRDERPSGVKAQPVLGGQSEPAAGTPAAPTNGSTYAADALAHERQRRAGMVNAMLACANAERVDMPLAPSKATQSMAASSHRPLQESGAEGSDFSWTKRINRRVPSNLFQAIGVRHPATPRRV